MIGNTSRLDSSDYISRKSSGNRTEKARDSSEIWEKCINIGYISNYIYAIFKGKGVFKNG